MEVPMIPTTATSPHHQTFPIFDKVKKAFGLDSIKALVNKVYEFFLKIFNKLFCCPRRQATAVPVVVLPARVTVQIESAPVPAPIRTATPPAPTPVKTPTPVLQAQLAVPVATISLEESRSPSPQEEAPPATAEEELPLQIEVTQIQPSPAGSISRSSTMLPVLNEGDESKDQPITPEPKSPTPTPSTLPSPINSEDLRRLMSPPGRQKNPLASPGASSNVSSLVEVTGFESDVDVNLTPFSVNTAVRRLGPLSRHQTT